MAADAAAAAAPPAGRSRAARAAAAAASSWARSALLVLAAAGVAAAGASAHPATPTAAPAAQATPPGPLCDWPQCNCTLNGSTRVVARCRLAKNQEVEVTAAALPAWLLELHVEGGGSVRVAAAAFSAVRDVRLLNVSALTGALVLRRHSFLNVSSQHVNLHVSDCAAVVFETQAFRSPAGPASLEVRRCGHVVVQSSAFAWLLRARLSGVARLELASNAFALEQPDGRRHGPAPSVVLESVMLAELPPLAFPSQVAEVVLSRAQVRAVRRDAFYALQLSAVRVEDSTLQRVDAGAFSPRTLVLQLRVLRSRIGVLAEGALRGAVGNLSIEHTQMDEVESGAVDITVAKVSLLNCSLGDVHSRAFAFREWNSVVVQRSSFRVLGADGVWAPFQRVSGVRAYELRWIDNRVADLRAGALAAVAGAAAAARGDAAGELEAEVRDLWLEGPCRCDLGERLSGEGVLLAAASCAVDAALARCLGLSEGRAAAQEYAARVCDHSERVLVCEASPAGAAAAGSGLGADALPPASAAADDDTSDRGRKVLTLVFAGVSLGSLVVLAASGAMWLRRKGHCRGAGRWAPPASAASCLAQLARLWATRRAPAAAGGTAHANGAGAAGANGPTVAGAAHYTELQQRRDGGLVATADDDYDEEAGGAGGADAEDKWTQTMPEELTQELLQALREKLDDPENYSEARDMIEHLYDLIKVEESCSNNNRPAGAGTGSAGSLADLVDADDNLYEAIRPRVRRARGDTCSVGTRAPSPDALEPAPPASAAAAVAVAASPAVARARAPLLCEYGEPRDRAQHLYAEVPGGVPLNPASSPPRVSRPLSFLRSLGESLQAVLPSGRPAPSSPPPPPPTAAASPPGSPRLPASLAAAAAAAAAAQPTTSLLCEYAEPTDAQVHVYSELPPAMVNRPLPDTPAAAAPSAAPHG